MSISQSRTEVWPGAHPTPAPVIVNPPCVGPLSGRTVSIPTIGAGTSVGMGSGGPPAAADPGLMNASTSTPVDDTRRKAPMRSPTKCETVGNGINRARRGLRGGLDEDPRQLVRLGEHRPVAGVHGDQSPGPVGQQLGHVVAQLVSGQ